MSTYRYIWYIHFFVYIIYTKNVYIDILLYIQLYIQYIYTVYEIWKWPVYMYIYSVYEILRFCIYTVYIQPWALHMTYSNIFRLRFLQSNNDFQICIYDIYTFCIYNVYIHCIWNFQKACIYVYIHLYMKILSFVYSVYIHAIYTLFVYIIYTYRHPRLKITIDEQ